MAQWVMCLPRKCKDLIFIPRTHRKTGFGHNSACLWCALRRRVGWSLAPDASQSSEISRLQLSERPWPYLMLTPGLPHPIFIHIHVWNTHTHIYIHSHTYMCETHVNKSNKPHPWKQTNVKSWRGRWASRLLSDACYVSKIGRLKLLTLHYTSSPRTRTSCSCCKTPFPRTWSQSTHLLVACLECRPGTLVPLWFPLCLLIMFSLKGHTPMSRRRYPKKKKMTKTT